VSHRLRASLPYPAGCYVFFGSHGCDLAAGHPPELGHICLYPDDERLPGQSQDGTVELSLICTRVEADDPDVWMGSPDTYPYAAPGPRPCHPAYWEKP
jgi:hypothetical protein